nr:restriction endonuclease [Sporolactobacillus spathodeae]
MVRAGDNNELVEEWLKLGIASIGWPELGDPGRFKAKEQILKYAENIYADGRPQSIMNWVSQIWRFKNEIKENDRVVSYSKEKREYIVGTVVDEFFYAPSSGDVNYPNHIKVNWEEAMVNRDSLSQSAKNSLGSTLTIFQITQWGNEFQQLIQNPHAEMTFIPTDIKAADERDAVDDFIAKAQSMVEDRIDRLDPWQMQDLVAGLLEAMGYNTQVSPKGPDGGIDILAYKDAFGFERPIIKVQVKHRKSSTGGPEIQQLLGANPSDANSLFISTGGFTNQADRIANRNGVKLLDLEKLVTLIMEWYDKLPTDKQALIPLQKIYVPDIN